MRLALIGDSHLARISGRHPRALEAGLPGWPVVNVSIGGSTLEAVDAQLDLAGPSDAVVMSVGTNDARPIRGTSRVEFEQRLGRLRERLPERVLLLDPPGLVESLDPHSRRNNDIHAYGRLARDVLDGNGTTVLTVADLVDVRTGEGFVSDGCHFTGAVYRELVSQIVGHLDGSRARAG